MGQRGRRPLISGEYLTLEYMKKAVLLLLTLLLTASCKTTKEIVGRPIIFNEERKELTREYLKQRYAIIQENIEIVPRMIVLHHTVIPTFEKTFEAFNPPTLPNWRPEIENVSGLNVSSHFVVDQDGTIYQLMPENYMARHVIGLNHCSIGIENVGGTEEVPLTQAQVRSNIWLVKYLADKFPIAYLIGHYEYTRFERHPLWLEIDDGYRTKKNDPSKAFMKKVRKGTRRLNFKPIPNF